MVQPPSEGRMPFAEVAVDAPVRDGRTFTYSIPTHLTVAPGQMVQVPFGPRMADGVVFQLSHTTKIDLVRPIEVADPLGLLVSSHHLDLARWISDYYMAPLYAAVALMLPPGFRSRTVVYLKRPSEEAIASLEAALPASFLSLFSASRQREREELVRGKLDQKAGRTLDRLIRKGEIARSWEWRILKAQQGHAPPTIEENPVAEPALTPTSHQAQSLAQIAAALDARDHAAFLLQGVTGSGKTEVYIQSLSRCLAQGRKGIVLVPEISLTPQMVQRFEARFPGKVAVLHSRLSPADHTRMWWGLFHGRYDVAIGSRSALFAPVQPLGLIVLDEEHEWTYKQDEREPRYHARVVALRLAQQTDAVVVLGSATPDVVTYHHALAGQSLRLLELPYRLGTSVPAGGLGVSPRFNTPPLRIGEGDIEPVLSLPKEGEVKAPLDSEEGGEHHPMAQVRIVDMRQELKDGNRSVFSRPLQEALKETVGKGDQAILFINRRGAAGVVQCRDCGHVVRCRTCDMPLAYHTAPERLLCHQCNRRSKIPQACPNCHSARIRYLGLGTQKLMGELDALLPSVTTLRWDRDVAETDRASNTVLERFARGEAQVLVGTQMVAKGLHVPSVTLVGAVLADIGLHLPDFRSGERVFQLLCQVAGRAGRGDPGVAIVQTYRPDHYAVVLAAQQDYPAFYRQEVAYRRVQRLPPYGRLIRLVFAHINDGRCQAEVERLGRVLRYQRQAWAMTEVDVMGPAPAYPPRLRGRYRWHILLRGPDPRLLLDKVELSQDWLVDVDPASVL
ncbi:MAG: primosomal protein N' [Dehalococcoidia bacterium]|nr:primosomal protein N' [Dehalococcoidia bacterium]